MKRALFLALVALLLAALGVVVWAEIPASTAGMPAVAQARLARYLADVYPDGNVQVQAAVRARRAGRFDPEMGGLVFGDSVYYQADLGPTYTERDNLLPLPYPPRELWCVLLEEAPAEGTAIGHVVFPALHMDIYSADWLVHEASPDWALAQTLDAVGCALPLE